jgi:hypothetical protein
MRIYPSLLLLATPNIDPNITLLCIHPVTHILAFLACYGRHATAKLFLDHPDIDPNCTVQIGGHY